MSLEQRVCPGCGGPVAASAQRCEHCGAWFGTTGEARAIKLSASFQRFFSPLPTDAGEFGVSGLLPLLLGLTLATALYALGWILEDREYWLAPGAVALWAAALPVWLGLVSLTWKTTRTVWPVGLAIALVLLGIHLGIMWLIRGRINDDMLGIAAIYAALGLSGWLLGRLAHFTLRRRRMGDRQM